MVQAGIAADEITAFSPPSKSYIGLLSSPLATELALI